MDFATDGGSKALNVEFLQPATKPAFTLAHTDATNNKFTIDFTNHDGNSTDLVSVLVTVQQERPLQILRKYNRCSCRRGWCICILNGRFLPRC